MFEKMLELVSTKAMFNGHDHVNNTTFEYKGIQFSYGYSVDYFAYSGIDKLGSQRGCTMITCKPDTTFTIANFNQGWPKFALSAFMHNENTIINSVMIPSVLKDNGVTIRLETDYPFNNKMHYYIDAQKDFNFVIRIPSFSKNLKINGECAETRDLKFAIKQVKTEIEVEFCVAPFLKERPNNLYALQMGSLLFSVPIEYEKKMREYVKRVLNANSRIAIISLYQLHPGIMVIQMMVLL